jgi:hypothetical protein
MLFLLRNLFILSILIQVINLNLNFKESKNLTLKDSKHLRIQRLVLLTNNN